MREITGTSTLTGSVSGTSRAAILEQKRSVEHAEHLGDVRRFRAGLMIAIPTYVFFGVLDAISVRWAGAASLAWFWGIRYGFCLSVVPFTLWAVCRKTPPSPRLFHFVDILLYGGAAWAIAVMATRYGGIASHYVPGIMMVIVARAAFSAQRWSQALLPNLVIASSYPVVMGVALLLDPALRAQLHEPNAATAGMNHLLFVYGTTVLAIAGGHHAWTLRRQLFESRSIGRYRLKKRIGAGGMGEVWAAYHAGLKRDIALKILRPDASGDVEAIARFEREVKATSELSHPNTVRVFDFGVTDDGIFYYAMELLEGRNLGDLVKAEGPLPVARAIHLVIQASRSLAEAHEHGIIHRDVKPGNLFVTRAGGEPDFVKLLDFGIAKVEEPDANVELTGTGVLAGTPKYMAPEVVLGKGATPASDVYGMGAVFFFLLTGRAPFEGDSASAIYLAHLHDAVPRPSTVRGEPVPASIERLVARCLAKDPAARFADAGALADALGALVVTGPSLVPSPLVMAAASEDDRITIRPAARAH